MSITRLSNNFNNIKSFLQDREVIAFYLISKKFHPLITKTVPQYLKLQMQIFRANEIRINDIYWGKKFKITSFPNHLLVDSSIQPFKGGMKLTAESLDVLVQTNGLFFESIPLDKKLTDRLLTFLVKGRPAPGFSCVDFVQYLYDQYEAGSTNTFHQAKWIISPYVKTTPLPPGEIIILAIDKGEFSSSEHFALYLGYKLFLSVAGAEGYLIVTDLEEMENIYKTNKLFRITLPNPQI